MRDFVSRFGLAALFGFLAFAWACTGTPPPQSPAQTSSSHGSTGFRSEARLAEHFEKHGREVGARSEEEYLRMARTLRDAPAVGSLLEATRGDGVITRFDRRTGLFIAFGEDGTIRTFFRPRDGEAYFRRQLERGHSE